MHFKCKLCFFHVLVLPLPPFTNCLPVLHLLPHKTKQGRSASCHFTSRQNFPITFKTSMTKARLRDASLLREWPPSTSTVLLAPTRQRAQRRPPTTASRAEGQHLAWALPPASPSTAAETTRGSQPQRPIHSNAMDCQGWTSVSKRCNGERKAQQSLTYVNSIAGEKTHPGFLNNLLHNVMICD